MKQVDLETRYENDTFWLSDPSLLFDGEYIFDLFPTKNNTLIENLNSLTRVIILITLGTYIYNSNLKVLITGLVIILVISIIYTMRNNLFNNDETTDETQEGYIGFDEGYLHDLNKNLSSSEFYNENKQLFQEPTSENPMMNVSFNDINNNPNRKAAAPSFNETVIEEINNSVKSNLDPKLFKDLGDELDFDNSMRQFHTNPSTTIPNDQKSFAEFCYGDMSSCKDGNYMQCMKHTLRHTLR